MKTELALRHRDALVSRLRSAFSAAEISGITSTALNDSVRGCYAAVPAGAPSWVKEYGRGYEKALYDGLYERHLMFGGFYNGQWYSTHSKRDDYYGRNGIDASAFADDGAVTARGHYWINRPGNPFFISARS